MPKQRINTPFVLMLVGALVLVIGGASAFYFLAVYQDPASRVVEARQHLDNGDYRLAIEQLVAATKAEPTNIEYQNLLFDALRASPVADIPQANKRLGELRTIRRNVATLRLSDPEAQRAHYAFLNELRRDLDPGFVNVMYNEANERLQSVESDTVALKYRGIASVLRFARGVADADERQQARVDLNAALEADPNDGESLHALATWLMLEAERIARVAAADPEIERLRSEAGTVLDRLIEAAGDDIGLKLDYVSLAILPEAQRRSNAVEVFNEVEQQLLNAGGSRSNALTVLNILGRGSGGGPTIANPDDAGGQAAAAEADRQRAVQFAERMAELDPQDASIRLRLASLYRAQGEPAKAVATAEEVRQLTATKAPPLETLRARLVRLRASLEMTNALFLLADQQDAEGREPILARIDEIASELEISFPDAAEVTLLSGKLAFARRDFRQAGILFDEASAQYGESNIETLMLSARTRRFQQQWGAAAERYESVLASRPNMVEARRELIQVYLSEQRPNDARRHISTLLTADPNDAFANQALAQLVVNFGTDAEKERVFEAIDTEDPSVDIRTKLLAVRLLDDLNRDEEARDLLIELNALNPGNTQVIAQLMDRIDDQEQKLALIATAEAEGADEQAIELLRTVAEGGDVQDIVQGIVRERSTPFALARARAQAALRVRNIEAAEEAIAEAEELEPENDQIVELKFDLAMIQQDYAGARQVAEIARQRNLDRVNGAFYEARVFAAEQRYEEATATLLRGLDINRINPESWTLLGEIYRRQGLLDQAADAIDLALSQRANNLDALRLLAGIRDDQGRSGEALDALRRAYQLQPDNAGIRNLYLLYETRHGQAELALAARERLANEEPTDYANKRALTAMLAEAGRADEALALVESLLEDEGAILANIATQASTLLTLGRGEEGEREIRRYIASRGDEATANDYRLLARYRLQANNLNGAVQAYREGITREDESLPLTRELAGLLFQRGESDLATTLYQKLNQRFPEEEFVTLRLVESLLRANRLDDARTFLDEQTTQDATTLLLRSQLVLQEGDRDGSLELVQQSLQLNPDSVPALIRRANLVAFDDPDQALIDLDRALTLDPSQTAARLLLSDVHRRSGNYIDAVRELQNILNREPLQTQARQKLIDLHLRTGEPQLARAVAQEGLQLQPQNTLWHRLAARVAVTQGRASDAVQNLREAFAIQPNAANLGALLALLADNDRPDLALNLIDQNPELTAAEPTIQAIRAQALAMTGSREASQRVFTRALERASNYPEMNAIADRVQRSFDIETAIDLLVNTTRGREPLWSELAAARLETNDGRYDEAVSRLRALEGRIEGEPDALRFQMLTLLGRALQLSDAFVDARVAYEEVLKIQPSDLLTLNNLAFLLGNNLGEPELAVEYAQRAVNLAPQNPNTLDTLGWVQYQAGLVDEARRTLELSISFGRLPVNQYHLAVVLADQGSVAAARDLLEQAIEDAEASGDQETLEKARERLRTLAQG